MTQQPDDLYARIYRAVYTSPDGAATEAVMAVVQPELDRLRAELEQTRQSIADIQAYCPDHGTAETCRIQCHCAIADELTAPAARPSA